MSLLLLDVTSTAYATIPEDSISRGVVQAVAIGGGSSTDAHGAVVVGAASRATGGVKGIAIGHTVFANGQDAVAIGSNSQSVTQG